MGSYGCVQVALASEAIVIIGVDKLIHPWFRTSVKVIPVVSPEPTTKVRGVEAKDETHGLVEFDGTAMFLVP